MPLYENQDKRKSSPERLQSLCAAKSAFEYEMRRPGEGAKTGTARATERPQRW
jgi:hypothetical protein